MTRLRTLLSRGRAATAPLWPEIPQAYAWVHRAAHLLANAEQRSLDDLRQAYAALLAEMAARRETLPTLAPAETEERLRTLGSEFGAVTGRPRRCGWFDATVVRYAVRVNGLTALAVTKLDVLDSFDRIPVGVAYDLDGGRCEEMPAEAAVLERVRPVYQTLDGWCTSTAGARSLAQLPRLARAYLDRLEELAGPPIRYVSVGSRRDQIIEVRP